MWWLAPFAFAGTPWGAAMATGDCGAVILALVEPTTDPERLALARCEARQGHWKRAADVGGGITGDLRGYGAVLAAEALLGLGRPEAALTALVGVDIEGSGDDLLRAKVYVAAGRFVEARATLAKLSGPEASWWLGKAQESSSVGEATSTYVRVWTTWPSSTWSELAESRLGALGHPVPDVTTESGRAAVLLRARTLLSAGLADRAVPLLDSVNEHAPFVGPSVRFMAESLFAAKLYPRAVEWFGKASIADPKGAFQRALATARSGDYPAAAMLYQQLVERWPTSREADEATWKPAYMEYDAGRLEAAIDGFGVYLQRRPSGAFAADARWFCAWSHYKLGHVADAIVGFDEVVRLHPTTDVAPAARYWKARAQGSDEGLRAVISRNPDTSYAFFAAERLGLHPAEVAVIAAPPAFPAEFLAVRPKLRTALALLDAGMPDLALPLLRLNVSAASAGGETTALAMADALVRGEDFVAAQKLAGPYCGRPQARSSCVPRPHVDTVSAIAIAGGLDPLLPYAIMTAESGLDPGVTSPAGARGLMQLMPTLASALAVGRVSGFAVDDLYRAGVNARLGTTELTLLHSRLAGLGVNPSLPLVIAGYNGGAEAVQRWVAGYPAPPDADRFAEDISFTETRRYVRRVLGYLMRYRRVYGG